MASRTKKKDAGGDAESGFSAGPARLVVMLGLAVVLGTAAFMLLVSDEPESAIVETTIEAAAATTTPPWTYDAATNKHWHPGHQHWHEGPPPTQIGAAGGGGAVDPPPNVPNPQPWQYDVASNRHFDPGHAHWHSGPPPAGAGPGLATSPVSTQRVDAPPGVVNPQPWQYDSGSDRHYHAGHAHWHAGPPPDPADR